MKSKIEYVGYIEHVNRDFEWEIEIVRGPKLGPVLYKTKLATRERGAAEWDWVVKKYVDGERVQVRSSVAGLGLYCRHAVGD